MPSPGDGGRPVRVTRAQRRQRGGERTAGAVGIFGLHSRRGEPLFPFAGEEPVRAFGIVEMAALHQYRAAAQRQQRPSLLQHFSFVTRMGASSSAAASGRFGVINDTCGNNR